MLHVLSGSRSSMLASILGGMVWISCSIKIVTLKRIAVGLGFGLIMTLGVSFLLLTKPASLKRGDATINTLTGRTEFWAGCLQLIREKPVQGYGYGVAGKVWEDPRFQRDGEFLWEGSAKASLHNGYLSLAIGLGVIGLVMWLLFLSMPVCKVISLGPSPYKTFLLMIIVELLVLNFFESALSSGSQIHTSLIFWFILILAGRLPDIAAWQSELKKSYWGTDFGIINATSPSTGLYTGYAGA
jgi:O-antigen ligase